MPITKTAINLLPAGTAVAAGTLKATPVAGPVIDVRAYSGGELTYRITNTTAPGGAPTAMFQNSPDGTNWFDYQPGSGDTTASSVNTGSFTLTRGAMYLRVISYGNTTSGVTAEAWLQAVTES